MESNAQAQDLTESAVPALQTQPDHYSVLVNAIARASSDPARLRKLIYAMALQNLQSGAVARDPVPDPVEQATNLIELEQALQLEHAIVRIEQHAAEAERASDGKFGERPAGADDPPHQDVAPDRSLVLVAERRTGALADRIPAFLDPVTRLSPDTVEYAPVRQRSAPRTGLISFAQVVAASMVGVAFYAGIAGWVRLERQAVTGPALASGAAGRQVAVAATNRPETVGSGHPEMRQARAAPGPALPFPMPRTYGVYAGSDGRVAELQQLPINIPTARFQMSAEITEPSRTSVSGDHLKFVVFKRDLVDRASESVSVRVVARVQRAMTFVNGSPTVMPLAAAWRVRDKSYQFKVSPVEGHSEMIVIEPAAGLVLPPGRYALLINGSGYDFTVAGPVTAPEQCLEQFQVQNGVVLSECPKS